MQLLAAIVAMAKMHTQSQTFATWSDGLSSCVTSVWTSTGENTEMSYVATTGAGTIDCMSWLTSLVLAHLTLASLRHHMLSWLTAAVEVVVPHVLSREVMVAHLCLVQ